jgi:putative RNA 2'-phosphotransferase
MPKRQQHKEAALVKTLLYTLARNPAEFGLVPDDAGWVSTKELIKAYSQEEGLRWVRESMVKDAAQRLALNELELVERRIRAKERGYARPNYGVEPPAHIFVAVRRKAWPALSKRGLDSGPDRPAWVFSSNKERAMLLGKRRDQDPVLVTVQAAQAMDQGSVFAGWGEDLFLADWVPASCLMGPPINEKLFPPKPQPKRKKEPAKPILPSVEELPGSFVVNLEDVEKPYKRKGLKKEISWKNERRKDKRRRGGD